MTHRELTLLLTRPEPQSSEFLARCEREHGARISAVISPVFRIVDTGDIPPLDEYRSLIFTSGHAVRRVGEAGLLNGRTVATVGQATAELARDYGAVAKAYGADLETFLANCADLANPCLHLRGSHTRGDLAARLASMDKVTSEAVVYDQLTRPPTRAAQAIIAGTDSIIVPLFSPRSAQLLSRIIGRRADVTVVAISEAVAAASRTIGKAHIAAAPTVEAMCAATVASLGQAHLVERPTDD
ncbi:MAG: uroporphyrinogen-III synthase [Boseongicola sp.]